MYTCTCVTAVVSFPTNPVFFARFFLKGRGGGVRQLFFTTTQTTVACLILLSANRRFNLDEAILHNYDMTKFENVANEKSYNVP